jgi:hypothetical protein
MTQDQPAVERDLDRIADAGALIVAEAEAQLHASRGVGGSSRLTKGKGHTDTYEIHGPSPREYVAHMIGTTSETTGTFVWAWGYQPGEPTGPTIVHAIRTQGEQLGIPELAESEFVAEPRVLQRVLQAAAAISRIHTPAVFQTSSGDAGYFLVEGFEMPPPRVVDLHRAIETAMAGPGRPRDIRRALHQYAATRRIGFAEQADAAFLQAEDGMLVIGLGPDDEITGLGVQNAEQPSP